MKSLIQDAGWPRDPGYMQQGTPDIGRFPFLFADSLHKIL